MVTTQSHALSERRSVDLDSSDMRGLVWDIQRFNIHDGPGIRTLVFLKGCSLRCLWCQNPEGWRPRPELRLFGSRCIACGSCAPVCPHEAIGYKADGMPIIDKDRCTLSGLCTEACPSNALVMIGEYFSVEDVVAEVRKDLPFYWRSGGGLTATGGEPLLQPEFVAALFERCHEIHIDTAVETCGYVGWSGLQRVLAHTDSVLYDIKHMVSERHQELTGKPNELILRNARRIAETSSDKLVLRTPVVPGKNDDRENLILTARFAAELDVRRWDLLPYHRLGEGKYRHVDRAYPLGDVEPPDGERMQFIESLVKRVFARVSIEE